MNKLEKEENMLERIHDKVSVVFAEEGFTYGNCVLVDDDTRVLLDTGAGQALLEARPEEVDLVINTHYHYDHIRGNDWCKRAQVKLHATEQSYLLQPETAGNVSYWDELMPGEDPIAATVEIGIDPERVALPWPLDGEVKDGQVIDCGKTAFVVLHTPGHSPGHCSFYFPGQDFIFLGDICLTKVGPWYGEPGADTQDFIDSIDRVIALHPKIVATSHVNTVITNPEPILTEYRDRILKREQRILKRIRQRPLTMQQLGEQNLIYPEHPTAFVRYWEKAMLKKHLERLVRMGLVEMDEDGSYRTL
jgi:glyoxylase-like metal-dependent hydrolase (beta-lactamase superfamily II)